MIKIIRLEYQSFVSFRIFFKVICLICEVFDGATRWCPLRRSQRKMKMNLTRKTTLNHVVSSHPFLFASWLGLVKFLVFCCPLNCSFLLILRLMMRKRRKCLMTQIMPAFRQVSIILFLLDF
mgnify:CR=1 FL=1